jgi:hypothetical protein
MKITIKSVLPVLFVIATTFGGAYLDYFHGSSEDDNIRLEWKTGDENNINHFAIERKTFQTSFIEITSIDPKGSNSIYSYVDQSAYKPNAMIFIYRLKIVDNDNQVSYSSEITVSHSVSGVKHTWGSIKAMFR